MKEKVIAGGDFGAAVARNERRLCWCKRFNLMFLDLVERRKQKQYQKAAQLNSKKNSRTESKRAKEQRLAKGNE